MKIDYNAGAQSHLNWIRVGWILNLCFGFLFFLFSDEYVRAGICFFSSAALASVYITSRKRIAVRISFTVYLLLCCTEWLLLSYSLFDMGEVFFEGSPISFLLNIIVLITPLLYAGLRWIIVVLMFWVLWKTRKAKGKG